MINFFPDDIDSRLLQNCVLLYVEYTTLFTRESYCY